MTQERPYAGQVEDAGDRSRLSGDTQSAIRGPAPIEAMDECGDASGVTERQARQVHHDRDVALLDEPVETLLDLRSVLHVELAGQRYHG